MYESFLKLHIPLQEQTDEVLAEVFSLAALPVAVQGVDHRRRKPIPGARILDEVVHHLIQRLPAGVFHPLVEPAADIERNSDADVGQLDGPRSSCHSLDASKHAALMLVTFPSRQCDELT